MSSERPKTPNVPIRASELGDDAWESYARGSRFASRDLPLGDLGGAVRIGAGIMVLDPGKQSCPFHYHHREEEHFYVLAGKCVLRSGEERYVMDAGDYVCFPPGTGVAHAFENPFAEPCRIFVVGNRDPDEVCVYPDSGKVLVSSPSQRIITDFPEASLDYWHGEPVDEPLPDKG